VPHYQPVLAGHADTARQRLFDGHQYPEQDERDQNRKQRQRRPQLLPLQIAPDEVKKFHGGLLLLVVVLVLVIENGEIEYEGRER
jgi:hypothetical protein